MCTSASRCAHRGGLSGLGALTALRGVLVQLMQPRCSYSPSASQSFRPPHGVLPAVQLRCYQGNRRWPIVQELQRQSHLALGVFVVSSRPHVLCHHPIDRPLAWGPAANAQPHAEVPRPQTDREPAPIVLHGERGREGERSGRKD